MSTSETIPIEPMGKKLLVRVVKRAATKGGILIADSAAGYDDVVIVKVGPKVEPRSIPGTYFEPGIAIILSPGTYLTELQEFPGYALVDADQVCAIDCRTIEQRVEVNPRLHLIGGAT
jgi:co-chaperonin GroES (HSP10)